MKLISIIIPTYNHALFISDAVNSCLEQTYPNIEIIVVDDGSTDNTKQILEPYSSKIKYIYQKNAGPAAARNNGARASNGSYLLFLDSDDWLSSEQIALQIIELDKRPEYGLVYSAWKNVDETNKQIIGEVRPKTEGDVLQKLLLRELFFSPGAALIRKECFDNVGPFEERKEFMRSEDTEMWVRIAAANYPFAYLDEPLFFHRVVKNSLSHNYASHSQSEFARLEKFFNRKDLDAEIMEIKPLAFSLIHFEYCAKYYNIKNLPEGQKHLRLAIKTCPQQIKNSDWVLEWLAGYSLDPAVENPENFINNFFSNLPKEAESIKKLQKKALGRYHTAVIFNSYKSHDLASVKAHLIPAIRYDPKCLLNKGFLKIGIIALTN